jgi:hypothetical protein
MKKEQNFTFTLKMYFKPVGYVVSDIYANAALKYLELN